MTRPQLPSQNLGVATPKPPRIDANADNIERREALRNVFPGARLGSRPHGRSHNQFSPRKYFFAFRDGIFRRIGTTRFFANDQK